MGASDQYRSFLAERPARICSAFNKISGADFRALIVSLRARTQVFADTLHLHDDYDGFDCRTGGASAYGYAVTAEGELTNVFSCARGGGTLIMEQVKRDYDRLHLNCFDFSEEFYARHGFLAVGREPNWKGGEDMTLPDVVYMEWRKDGP